MSKVKTRKGWIASKQDFTDYVQVGDTVDEYLYNEMLGAVPPVLMSSSGFLMGEPANHNNQGKPLYMAFYSNKYVGIMTVQQFLEDPLCQIGKPN